MVRHHIVPELRPLCVSLLESDLDSRKQLESAVGSDRGRGCQQPMPGRSKCREKIGSERLDLLEKLDEIRHQLTEARADEYRDIPLAKILGAGRCCSPSCAGRKHTAGYRVQSLRLAPLPLFSRGVADLYRTGVSISREDEHELSGHLPELHDLPRPEDFEASISEAIILGWRTSICARPVAFQCWQAPQRNRNFWPGSSSGRRASFRKRINGKLSAVTGRYGDVHRHPWTNHQLRAAVFIAKLQIPRIVS